MFIVLASPSPREPPCTPEPVGGGEAVPRRGPGGPWLGRPFRRITPPPGHYELGAVGLHRRSERGDRRAVSDRTAAWKAAQEPCGAPGDWHLKLKTSRSLASCSL